MICIYRIIASRRSWWGGVAALVDADGAELCGLVARLMGFPFNLVIRK